ncbi:MAG: hypothetical protein SF029_03150 [bacterium]|nr:hypothetical protein [bacterium]
MPIHKMNFKDEVFFAKQIDYVDNVDAKMWLNALAKYARGSSTPIMAVVDATEATRLCPTVVKLFDEAIRLPNVRGVVIATGDVMTSQKSRVVSSLSELDNIRVVATREEAERYAAARLGGAISKGTRVAAAYSSFSMPTFSFAYAG